MAKGDTKPPGWGPGNQKKTSASLQNNVNSQKKGSIPSPDPKQLPFQSEEAMIICYEPALIPSPEQLSSQIKHLQKSREGLERWHLRPTYVQWLCTDRCRFHCDHCDIRTRPDPPANPPDELTTPEIIRALDTLSLMGCETFSVMGGDPFVREDLFEVLRYARKKGIKIALTTHRYDGKNFLHHLKDARPDSVIVSIDGYRSCHDQIRKNQGDYEQCLRFLQTCCDLGIPALGAAVTVMEENVHDIPKIIDDVYEAGGNRLRIQPLLSKNKQRNSPQVVKDALRQVYEARQKGFDIEMSEGFGYLGQLGTMVRSAPFSCGCGENTFTIMPDGKIMGCSVFSSPDHVEGNMREDGLRQIWFSRFSRFREELLHHLPLKCKNCQYVQICRGGCWLFRVHGQDPCFLPQAEEVAAQIGR